MRLLFFCLFLPAFSQAQPGVNADQFFALGLSAFKPWEKQEGEEVNFPWINQYEFRTETRDFDMDEQEYTFRLSPSTAKIRRAQRSLYRELRNAPDFEEQEIYCDLVLSLHLDWLSLSILNEKRRVMDDLAAVLQDRQTIYAKMAGSYELDPEKLLKLQTELSDLEIELKEIQLEWDYLLNKYEIQDQEIIFDDLIAMEAVSEALTASLLSSNQAEMVDPEAEYKEQLLVREMELESSENKRLVDFVQLKYNGPHSDALQERLSVGLGFQLSNSGSNKLKMQELQIEREELLRKSGRKMQEKQQYLQQIRNKLLSDLQAFFHLQEIMKEEKARLQELGDKIAQKEGSSPLFLLEMEGRRLSMEIKSLRQKEELLSDYLKYLRRSDAMCRSDFVNYLN